MNSLLLQNEAAELMVWAVVDGGRYTSNSLTIAIAVVEPIRCSPDLCTSPDRCSPDSYSHANIVVVSAAAVCDDRLQNHWLRCMACPSTLAIKTEKAKLLGA